MSDLLILLLIICALLYGLLKKVAVYDAFAAGAKEGLRTAVAILPNLSAMLIAVNLLRASGLLSEIQKILSPVFASVGIPREATPLMLIRPFSGSGALAVLESILVNEGPDSRAGLVSSALMGSSETIFYTLGIYMSAAKVSDSRYALPAALAAWIAGSCTTGLFYR